MNHYGLEGLSVPVGLIVQTNCFIEKSDDNHDDDDDAEMHTIPDDRMDSMYLYVVANSKQKSRGNNTRNKKSRNKKVSQKKQKKRK